MANDKNRSSDSAKKAVQVMRSGSGAKKVARAAATAGQRERTLQSRLGFPALVGLICVLGVISVTLAWAQRDFKPNAAVAEHQHAVYAVYDCTQEGPAEDRILPTFENEADMNLISEHEFNDGLIHWHPFEEFPSGPRSQMSQWFDAVNISVTDDTLTLPDGRELKEGAECADGSGPAELSLLRWQFYFQANADEPTDPEVITENFGDVKFQNDLETYVFVYAAADTEVPLTGKEMTERFASIGTASQKLTFDSDQGSGAVSDDGSVVVTTGTPEAEATDE